MSVARTSSARLGRMLPRFAFQGQIHHGLLRAHVPLGAHQSRRRSWPFGANALHNVPTVRAISFARVLPSLATKLIRIPAMVGAATVSGLAYIQYQATQAGSWAMDGIRKCGEMASGAAGSLFGGAIDMAEQTKAGWDRTKENINLPDWLRGLLPTEGASSEDGSSGGGGEPPNKSKAAAAAAVASTGAAFGYSHSPEDDDRSAEESARDDQMMMLTKKMIEIRSMLKVVKGSDSLTLPSIVVIGSQSSGKSSVLEAVVGHEFLPKGSNMITRRPIELTLVNTPNAQAEYGVFPAMGPSRITDFSRIQKTLTDLNLDVPAADCVTDDPIQLSIYSPNVPDLSLIDLPGYVQVSGLGQPEELKQKIADLCDKYIQTPNIILAISSADADLATSTALRASRRVDPEGKRTIGVITKMDLVEPARGAEILADRKFPLRLGYVGVISRIPQSSGGLFSRGNGNIMSAISKTENAFFSAHSSEFGSQSKLAVGTTTLRKKLMQVLERTMALSLKRISFDIHQELQQANYDLQVKYNDAPLTAESYLAESLDAFKHSFKGFAESYGKPQLRDLLKATMDQCVLNFLAESYWNKPIEDLSVPQPDIHPLSDLPKAGPNDPYWHDLLDSSTRKLTQIGIGRLATNKVTDSLQREIMGLILQSPFKNHSSAIAIINGASEDILIDGFDKTSEQLETCVKPYKFEIEVGNDEWVKSRQNAMVQLKEDLRQCDDAFKSIEHAVGGKRKLTELLSFIDRVRKEEIVLQGDSIRGAGGYSEDLLKKGLTGLFYRDRSSILQMRLMAIKSKQCSSPKGKYYCPEIFLDVVADKMVSTAVPFINVELLRDLYTQLPRELDDRLGRNLLPEDIERIARQNPKIGDHLDAVRRKEMLELVLEKIKGLSELEGSTNHKGDRQAGRQRANGYPSPERKRWLF